MSISITEAHQVIGILLAEIRKLNKEVARAEAQKIDVFMMGCREHAKGLVEGNRFPMYCAVCGKPHTTVGDEEALPYARLKQMYEGARRGQENISQAADALAKDAKLYKDVASAWKRAAKKWWRRSRAWEEAWEMEHDDYVGMALQRDEWKKACQAAIALLEKEDEREGK